MTRKFEALFENNVQRRLGHKWAHCKHSKCTPEVRGLLNDWVIARYNEQIAPYYTVEFTERDPYSGDAELRRKVSSTNHILVFKWSPEDTRQHFLSPHIGMLYQALHDIIDHVQAPNDFGTKGERRSMHRMKADLIAYAHEQGYSKETIKYAVSQLVSHTYLRVLGILWHLETYGNLDKYSHRVLCLRSAK